MTTATNDQATLDSIVCQLDASFIVEAGAGTGKTYALVSRVVALVKKGVRMQNIAAITFTEAAAAELSERIRSRMEQLLNEGHPDNDNDLLAQGLNNEGRRLIRQAIAELDQATVQTIHSFASQLLRDRPLDAQLPPGWANLDEVETSQRFADQWNKWLQLALGDPTQAPADLGALQPLLRRLIESGAKPSQWQDIAQIFSENCDRLDGKASIADGSLNGLCERFRQELKQLRSECDNRSDTLYKQITQGIAAVDTVQEVAGGLQEAAKLFEDGSVDFPSATGRTDRNWNVDTQEIRDRVNKDIRPTFLAAVLIAPLVQDLLPLLHELREEFALKDAARRKAEGVATFDDLLVWARDLLRDNADARRRFQERYTHILIDEFQDTDPLQAEIAFYLAAQPDANIVNTEWHSLQLVPGKLFIVGDSKQSIYRFRRADIGVTETVKRSGDLTRLTLTENRRSQKPVLDWVNAVFGDLMVEETGRQAKYINLEPNASLQRDGSGSVQAFGEPQESGVNADAVRQQQAGHVASLIVNAAGQNSPHRLEVYDKEIKGTRRADLRDICILIRSRTGLGTLTRELEDAGIPYRLEGGSLFFDTQEVQDLLNCLRAIDDPTDAVSVVAALRSPAFACSDVELLSWREARGPWDYRSPLLDDRQLAREHQVEQREKLLQSQGDSSVWAGLLKIRSYHQQRQTTGVARLIAEFIRERRLDELDLVENRPREVWRRRQFLRDQARQLEYASSTGPGTTPLTLHKFLQWAELQQDERARVTEVAVPESDDDAVRIMTVHAAKGLEFPIVILLGLDHDPTDKRGPRGYPSVLFSSPAEPAQILAGAWDNGRGLMTPGYAGAIAEADRHALAEAVRLAYVAATRARDHLLVSLYQSEPDSKKADKVIAARIQEMRQNFLSDGLLGESEVSSDGVAKYDASDAGQSVESLGEYDPAAWKSKRNDEFAGRAIPQAVTATRVAKASARPDAEVDDKDAEPDTERPSRAGRGGTAFGSALHAVLQEVADRISDQLPLPAGAAVDDLLAKLDPGIGQLAEEKAKYYGVSASSEISTLANRALRSAAVAAALRAPRLWSEIPVAAPIETRRGTVVIEGIIDLLYEHDDGQLVILDYKSDRVDGAVEMARKLDNYRMQGAAYAAAIEQATGRTVKAVQFLFVRLQDGLREIENIRDLIDGMPDLIAGATEQMYQGYNV